MSISLTWASPVTPGRTLNTPLFSLSSTNSIWLGRQGLGPTRLIWPVSTLNNCGSSSNLVLRKKLPSLVIEAELTRWVPTESVLVAIVRNLTRVKSFCLLPTRCWKNSGDPVSKIPIKQITSMMGRLKIMPMNENNISSALRKNGCIYWIPLFNGLMKDGTVSLR